MRFQKCLVALLFLAASCEGLAVRNDVQQSEPQEALLPAAEEPPAEEQPQEPQEALLPAAEEQPQEEQPQEEQPQEEQPQEPQEALLLAAGEPPAEEQPQEPQTPAEEQPQEPQAPAQETDTDASADAAPNAEPAQWLAEVEPEQSVVGAEGVEGAELINPEPAAAEPVAAALSDSAAPQAAPDNAGESLDAQPAVPESAAVAEEQPTAAEDPVAEQAFSVADPAADEPAAVEAEENAPAEQEREQEQEQPAAIAGDEAGEAPQQQQQVEEYEQQSDDSRDQPAEESPGDAHDLDQPTAENAVQETALEPEPGQVAAAAAAAEAAEGAAEEQSEDAYMHHANVHVDSSSAAEGHRVPPSPSYDAAAFTATSVSCGDHTARSCAECTTSCGGDCVLDVDRADGSFATCILNPNPVVVHQHVDGDSKPEHTLQKKPEVTDRVVQTTDRVVQKVFFINLARDQRRRMHVKTQIDKFQLPSEWIPGMVPSEMGSQEDYKVLSETRGCDFAQWSPENEANEKLKKLLRSCCSDFAHRRGYQRISEQEVDGLYLLVEDDVVFDADWEAKLREAMKSAPSDWDVLRLGWWGESDPSDRVGNTPWMRAERRTHPETDNKGNKLFYYYGAHAVLLTPAKAAEFVRRLKKRTYTFADSHTGFQTNDLNVYALANPIVTPTDELGSSRNDGYEGFETNAKKADTRGARLTIGKK